MRRDTNLTTRDGLRVYDLDTQAGELWAVAGPAGYDVNAIDPEFIPDGFRWVSDDEWAALNGTFRHRITATWNDDQQQYQNTALGWYSADGNDWEYLNGHPVDSVDFRSAEIHLEGGPRNGVVVG